MEESRECPKSLIVIDAFGVTRNFAVNYPHSLVGGFLVEASENVENGYQFSAFSQSSFRHAISELIKKIKARTSTRYLIETKDGIALSHDRIKGHITNTGLVVDGNLITFERLAMLLRQTEGFYIDIRLRELNCE